MDLKVSQEARIKEIKDKLEALLFASGRKMDLDELSRLVRVRNRDIVKAALAELKADVEAKQNTLVLIEDNNTWKLTIKEQYIDLVREINTNTEMSKTIMETLAVIAWKQPMLQCDVIKIRTNKAYDHIAELMEQGFIVKEKYGRTYLLKLTQKFFEYFDVRNDESLKALFKDISAEVLNKKKVDAAEAEKKDSKDAVKSDTGANVQADNNEKKASEDKDGNESGLVSSVESAAEPADIKDNSGNADNTLPLDAQAIQQAEEKKEQKVEIAVEQAARIKELMERAKAAIDGSSANASDSGKDDEEDGEGDDGGDE